MLYVPSKNRTRLISGNYKGEVLAQRRRELGVDVCPQHQKYSSRGWVAITRDEEGVERFAVLLACSPQPVLQGPEESREQVCHCLPDRNLQRLGLCLSISPGFLPYLLFW